MEACRCFLEVDVNGEEIFMVDKKIVSSFSGKLRNLFRKSKGTRYLKVIFHEFPGGAVGFELMSRFCYNNGAMEISPSNIALLYSVAQFMEMNKSLPKSRSLLEQIQKSLEEIRHWTWPELLVALKQCQHLLPYVKSSGILQNCLDSIVRRLVFMSDTSTRLSTSSRDSSLVRLSFESRSTESSKNLTSRAPWWFEDLIVLNPYLIGLLAKTMVSLKFDHVAIGRFLLYYQKSKFVTATSSEKYVITEMVIDALGSLDQSSVPCKSLFRILWVAMSFNIDKICRDELENMIGSQMDQCSLDNLLFPSPRGKNYLYDVNLVLRFLKAFRSRNACKVLPVQLKKVASLVDLYITEVAPDPHLKPSKFLALVTALPDCARESCDGIYRAMDMYLEVHAGVSKESLIKIWRALNYEKLSYSACVHLSQNMKFPSKSAVQALLSQQIKLRGLIQDVNQQSKCFEDSPFGFAKIGDVGKSDEPNETYYENFDVLTDNQKLSTRLQGMQLRVMELEKGCKQMQSQVGKIKKSTSSTPRSLSKFF